MNIESLLVQRKRIALACILLLGFGAANAQQENEITFNGEAGRIINENCVVCHREGGIGPMAFESYEQVRPWAPLIQLKVANREMPPYAYDHGIGIQDLEGDWRLSRDDIDTLVSWVDQGALLGDPDIELPPADVRDPDDWNFADQLGQPDLIVPSIAIDIPAAGNDIWHKHIVPSGLTEDRCIKAVQVKPKGNAATVVHHANSSTQLRDEDAKL